MFVNDDPQSKKTAIQKSLKTCDRLFWIEYSIHVDDASLRTVVARDWNWHGVVYPCVTEGIDWNMFKDNIDTSEPISQKGLSFDTKITKRIKDDFYDVEKTFPKCFCLDSKHCLKNMKKDKTYITFEDFFSDLLTTKFKLAAFTAARLTVTYTHECLGNIMGAAGVKANTA